MASSGEDAVDDALNVLINVTKKSGNLRNDLRKDILQAVSKLRKEVAKLKCEVEGKNKLIGELEKKAVETNNILNALQAGEGSNGGEDHGATSLGWKVNPTDGASDWKVAAGRTRKSYSDVVADRQGTVLFDKKRYKLFVKSKNNQSVEYTRTLLKSKVNPTQLKVGISALKTLKNGQILIESDNKSDLEEVNKRIFEACGEELEGHIPTLKNPRLIVFNVPEDVTVESVAQAIVLQNSDLDLNESDIKPKFVFQDRRKHKNLVIEVNSETRKRLRDRKLKIGWHVCNSSDYLSVPRCYKCSKYNHRATECFGEVTCPHCAQTHKMHECKASKEDYRCVNCTNYNKYNTPAQVSVNHSSLDKTCSCYKAALRKYIDNIDY
jgi:hypothetical protein